jgi:hypothetical protein
MATWSNGAAKSSATSTSGHAIRGRKFLGRHEQRAGEALGVLLVVVHLEAHPSGIDGML